MNRRSFFRAIGSVALVAAAPLKLVHKPTFDYVERAVTYRLKAGSILGAARAVRGNVVIVDLNAHQIAESVRRHNPLFARLKTEFSGYKVVNGEYRADVPPTASPGPRAQTQSLP